MPQGQGIEPWTHKIDRVQGQGFEPWTYQKDRAIVHTIAHTIARAIVKINMCTNACADARMSSTWNMSARRRTTARPTERRTDRSNFLNFQNILRFSRIMKKDAYCTKCLFLYTDLYQESWIQPRLIYKGHMVNMPYLYALVKTYQIWGIRSICLQVCTCGKHTTEMVYHANCMISVDFHFHF